MKRNRIIINPISGKAIPDDQINFIEDTIIIYGLGEEEAILVKNVAKRINAKVLLANDFTDLIAYPSFYIIIDPNNISSEEIDFVIDFWKEADEKYPRVLFTKKNQDVLGKKGSPFIVVDECILRDGRRLEKELSTHMVRINRKLKPMRQYDKKVFRILRILKKLQKEKEVYTSELAKEFHVTPRTIQRDMELLAMIGELIAYDSKKRTWSLMNDESILMDT